MVTERLTSVNSGLVDLEETFEDDGVLLAQALTDVAMAIGDWAIGWPRSRTRSLQ